MVHLKCVQSRGVTSRIILVLLAPLMLAGIGLIPQKILGLDGPDDPRFESHHSFRSIERMIHRNPDWMVLGRDFHPSRSNWALVIWHDGPLHPGLVDPDELLVLEHLDVSEAIVATMRVHSALPTAPIASSVDHDRIFTRELRGNLSFRSSLIGRRHEVGIFTLVDQVLARRVREIQQPAVSLTSALH